MPEQLCLQFGPSQHLQSLFLLPRLIFPNMPFMAQPHQIILNPMCAIYFQNFMTVIYPRLLCFSLCFVKSIKLARLISLPWWKSQWIHPFLLQNWPLLHLWPFLQKEDSFIKCYELIFIYVQHLKIPLGNLLSNCKNTG